MRICLRNKHIYTFNRGIEKQRLYYLYLQHTLRFAAGKSFKEKISYDKKNACIFYCLCYIIHRLHISINVYCDMYLYIENCICMWLLICASYECVCICRIYYLFKCQQKHTELYMRMNKLRENIRRR